ncbi:hypothetical protein L484_016261 [Morus notabilis]|uniref:Uncharacterized protein n=1 Tax=Morus notabilis TaxID=981085 RepID=W9R2Z4_9ROSA|nr:hypothetical protein L484_016261 [Morus notabilis]
MITRLGDFVDLPINLGILAFLTFLDKDYPSLILRTLADLDHPRNSNSSTRATLSDSLTKFIVPVRLSPQPKCNSLLGILDHQVLQWLPEFSTLISHR